MRAEGLFTLLAAAVGLFWFQRLCEDMLWVRKAPFHGADLHSTFQDEAQSGRASSASYRTLALGGRGRELAFPGGHGSYNATSASSPPEGSSIGTQILAEQAARERAEEAGSAAAGMSGCRKILWFMGLRAEDATQMEYYRYLQVALLTAKANAPSLVPHLVFDGAPNEVTAWFERQGGVVILHELTLEDVMREAVDAGYQNAEWLRNRGAFLRMDIPFIFPQLLARYADDPGIEKQYFLYTDNDVIFLKDITTCSFQPPPLFTIGAEHERGQPTNTGIMYVNAIAFAAQRDAIVEHGVRNRWRFDAMDQGLMLDYMAATGQIIPVLPDVFNWKGYWGSDDDVTIVHFHGPKPERCVPCLCAHPKDYWQACKDEDSCPDVYKYLFDKATDNGMLYKKMLQLYHVMRWEAEHS